MSTQFAETKANLHPKSLTSRINNLRDRIKGSNNGYLFAPTPEEVYVAMKYSQIFDVQFAALADNFPIRISLRTQ